MSVPFQPISLACFSSRTKTAILIAYCSTDFVIFFVFVPVYISFSHEMAGNGKVKKKKKSNKGFVKSVIFSFWPGFPVKSVLKE
ncbi:hypothetical protein GJAV_G00140770 [Gymnothorax javanicus]|nr:hypothetical protein GJAV_G00140770 [Gymnothorax javanicus]